MTYVTIYGEKVKGDIIKRLLNTVIVKEASGNTHMVHKLDVGEEKHGKIGVTMRKQKDGGFDLSECKRIGQTGRTGRRSRM